MIKLWGFWIELHENSAVFVCTPSMCYFRKTVTYFCLTVLEPVVRSISPTAEHLVWWLGHWWGRLGGTHRHSNSLAAAWPRSWWGCCSSTAGSPQNVFALLDDTGQTHGRGQRWRQRLERVREWQWGPHMFCSNTDGTKKLLEFRLVLKNLKLLFSPFLYFATQIWVEL